MAEEVDLNQFDPERFVNEEKYQEAVIDTPLGNEIAALFITDTLQDCAEFVALAQPDLLPKFFSWVAKNYPSLDIDPEEAVKLVKEAVEQGEISIEKP